MTTNYPDKILFENVKVFALILMIINFSFYITAFCIICIMYNFLVILYKLYNLYNIMKNFFYNFFSKQD